MSETTTIPAGEADTGAPHAPAYVPHDVLSSEPVEADPKPDTQAEPAQEADKPAEPAPKPEKTAEEKARENERRRYARLQAERSNEKARADQLEARLRELENPRPPDQPGFVRQEDLPRVYEEMRARERTQERVTGFHEQGQAAYPDWGDRCRTLMEMGADAAFADLLVEIPDGSRVAGALADDPDEMERITGLKTERARAIALGQYAAALQARPAAVPVVAVTRAPAPPTPPTGGRARGEPDPNGSYAEYQKWSEKQNWSRRG